MSVVQFIVYEDGSITDIKVIKSIGIEADQAAIDVVNSFNKMDEKWRPGYMMGKAVKVLYTMPIRF